MIEIDLQRIPNQRFNKEIDGVLYEIRFKTFDGLLFADISADGETLKSGVRCLANTLLIPYKYKTKGGNFMFYCINNDYPDYKLFGDTQQLVYLTDAEIDEINEALEE